MRRRIHARESRVRHLTTPLREGGGVDPVQSAARGLQTVVFLKHQHARALVLEEDAGQ